MGRNLRSRKLAAKACASKEDEINPVKTESKEEPLKKDRTKRKLSRQSTTAINSKSSTSSLEPAKKKVRKQELSEFLEQDIKLNSDSKPARRNASKRKREENAKEAGTPPEDNSEPAKKKVCKQKRSEISRENNDKKKKSTCKAVSSKNPTKSKYFQSDGTNSLVEKDDVKGVLEALEGQSSQAKTSLSEEEDSSEDDWEEVGGMY